MLLAGALVASLEAPAAWVRFALPVFALGLGGLLLSLSAGFAGLVALVCFGGIGLAAAPEQGAEPAAARLRRQPVAGAAVLLVLLLLCYSAVAGGFHAGAYPGGAVGSAVVARLLFDRDLVATEGLAVLLLAAFWAAGRSGREGRRR